MNKLVPLRVDIVSDVVCPWCVVGYKQFDQAINALPGRFDVTINWRPFELNPQMPAGGQNLREHLLHKAGVTREQSQAARQRLTAIGASLDFHFDFYDEMRIVNTFRAHQLLHWASEHDLQTELKLALFSAYFSRRENIDDIDVLVNSAASVGLPATEAREVLQEARYASAVRADEKVWLERDVNGVPAFVFNERYSVPGAQSADTFIQILEKLSSP